MFVYFWLKLLEKKIYSLRAITFFATNYQIHQITNVSTSTHRSITLFQKGRWKGRGTNYDQSENYHFDRNLIKYRYCLELAREY